MFATVLTPDFTSASSGGRSGASLSGLRGAQTPPGCIRQLDGLMNWGLIVCF